MMESALPVRPGVARSGRRSLQGDVLGRGFQFQPQLRFVNSRLVISAPAPYRGGPSRRRRSDVEARFMRLAGCPRGELWLLRGIPQQKNKILVAVGGHASDDLMA